MRVTNTNGDSIVVKIIDICPEDKLDLSETAFKKLAPLSAGDIPVSYDFVPCSVEGNIKYHVKDGSSSWWFAVYVENARIGVKKLEVKSYKSNTYLLMERPFEDGIVQNFFKIQATSELKTPLSFRLTGTNNEVLTDDDAVRL